MLARSLTALTLAALLSGCTATTPITATSQPTGPKTGEACTQYILGLFPIGNSSIAKAKREGDITVVSTVDNKTTLIPFGREKCSVVNGR